MRRVDAGGQQRHGDARAGRVIRSGRSHARTRGTCAATGTADGAAHRDGRSGSRCAARCDRDTADAIEPDLGRRAARQGLERSARACLALPHGDRAQRRHLAIDDQSVAHDALREHRRRSRDDQRDIIALAIGVVGSDELGDIEQRAIELSRRDQSRDIARDHQQVVAVTEPGEPDVAASRARLDVSRRPARPVRVQHTVPGDQRYRFDTARGRVRIPVHRRTGELRPWLGSA
jgi:hypothetical protein